MSLIIDAHTHVKHGDKDHTEVPAERVIAQMEGGDVDWSVIFSICEPSAASHERVLREWHKFPDRLIPFAHGLPLEGEVGQAEVRRTVEELGFAGVKVHFGEFSIERGCLPCFEDVLPLFETIAELGVRASGVSRDVPGHGRPGLSASIRRTRGRHSCGAG